MRFEPVRSANEVVEGGPLMRFEPVRSANEVVERGPLMRFFASEVRVR